MRLVRRRAVLTKPVLATLLALSLILGSVLSLAAHRTVRAPILEIGDAEMTMVVTEARRAVAERVVDVLRGR